MPEGIAYKMDELQYLGLRPSCFGKQLTDRLLAGDCEGAREAVQGLEFADLGPTNVRFRERRASKRALMRVDRFLDDPSSYQNVKTMVVWLLGSRADELFTSCARKLLHKGSEMARSGNKSLALAHRQLAIVLVGEGEVTAICEEERFSFACPSPLAPPRPLHAWAGFAII